jgi:hypothetical protein
VPHVQFLHLGLFVGRFVVNLKVFLEIRRRDFGNVRAGGKCCG